MTKPQHWAVSVTVDGANVLTIESNFLSGVDNIADHEETIETAALHLLAFIGAGHPAHYQTMARDNDRLRAVVLNIQSLVERGFPIDREKLATRCKHALNSKPQ
jgi:hypothetical protein